MGRVQFGTYTRKLRLKAKLSQGDLARELNFKTGQIVSNWERGQCYPPLENFKELASLYKVSLKSFFAQYYKHYMEDTWKKVSKSKSA